MQGRGGAAQGLRSGRCGAALGARAGGWRVGCLLIDFDHGVVDVERPIRLQGIYKRDVRVGHNVWMGYGACVLRGVQIGDNSVVGTNAVVTRSAPDNAVLAGVPSRVIRMRETPALMRWE